LYPRTEGVAAKGGVGAVVCPKLTGNANAGNTRRSGKLERFTGILQEESPLQRLFHPK
jgi:hypothetical protein